MRSIYKNAFRRHGRRREASRADTSIIQGGKENAD